ncbi:uncharacterized protein LOC134538339 [Bacillus rossius redtenbacheri]|uniref:uncharacterized protein LOC134538339 n=1 Tax=Bacillus rossius redtenbacheri TaxID=93214 RepID=UPI002FDE39B0
MIKMSKHFAVANKILILQEIRDKKETLFGPFSCTLTKEMKTSCWKEIHTQCGSLGLVAADKEWTYTRDVLWQNLKKSTMKKVDNRKKTGAAGGPDCKYAEVDILVLDIIGKDSPVIQSLGVTETWEAVGVEDIIETVMPEAYTFEVVENAGNVSELVSTPTGNNEGTKKKRNDSQDPLSQEPLHQLKKKKLMLQVEFLEKENYLKTLQILKLEKELDLAPSKFTESLTSVSYLVD